MEASNEHDAVYDALNLVNPQRFVNEVLNVVDDTIEDAFDFCLQQASQVTGASADRSEDLAQGVASIRNLTKAAMDRRMSMWEKYCLQYCFSLPDGFVLPQNNESIASVLQEDLHDADLDSQLNSLRQKLAVAQKRSEELHHEVHLIEKQSAINSSHKASLALIQELFKEQPVHDTFLDIGRAASRLQKKIVELKTKGVEDINKVRVEKIYNMSGENHTVHNKDLFSKLEDIQEVVSILRNA